MHLGNNKRFLTPLIVFNRPSVEGSSMLGELVPCGGGDSYPLMQSKVVVGRHADCDVCLPFRTVSSRHCELEFVDGGWFARDLGSHNGTGVNGIRCSEKRLMPNDVISFARQRYSIVYTPSSDRPKTAKADEEVSTELLVEPNKVVRAAQVAPKPSKKPRPSEQRSSLGKLVPCGGGDPISLWEPELTVGRHPKSDIPLSFRTVSAHHCKLRFTDGYWFVHDMNSRNGVRVDGVPCESKCLLPDSILSIATYRYQIIYTPSGDGPPPVEPLFALSLMEKAGLAQHGTSQKPLPRMNADDDDASKKRWALDENDLS